MGNIYREIFDHINKGIAVFDVINEGEAFEFVEYNQKAEMLDGKKRAAVLGKRLTEVFPFVSEFGFLDLLKKVYQTGQREYRPLTFYTHEGNYFWREIEVSLLPDNQILYVFSDLHNHTVRGEKREELFFVSQEIIEKSPFPKQILNTDGSIEYVNHAFEKITGYGKEECRLMSPPFPWWPNEQKDQLLKKYIIALSNETTESEWQMKNKADEKFWVQIKNTRVTYNGEIRYYFSYWYDITDRKKVEQQQIKTEMENRRILDSIVSALNIYDLKEERNIYVNKPYTHITGWTKEEINAMGQKYLEYFHPDDLPALLKHIKEVSESKNDTVKSHEYRFKRKDGRWIWLLTHDKPFERDEKGNVTKVIGSFIDVTERVNAVNALKISEKREKEANKAKSDFLANMSHEIRTPLNGVLGFTDLLMTTPLDDHQRQYVKNVQNSSIILMDLINDILDFSKIEAGKLDLENEQFDLKDMLEKTIAIVKLKVQEKGLVLKSVFSSDLPRNIHGDAVRLRQILLNFLSNAIKFTEKGKIELKVLLLEKDLVNKKAELLFSVSDTGIGIEKGKITTIVEEFSQEDSSTTRKFGGTGLGLAISKRLIEKMVSKLMIE
ncbi:MAG: PAS domain S-box protein, partial [Thermotogota bacterium]